MTGFVIGGPSLSIDFNRLFGQTAASTRADARNQIGRPSDALAVQSRSNSAGAHAELEPVVGLRPSGGAQED